MAPGHVPPEQMPLQQHLYTDPATAYVDLFARGDQYNAHRGTVPWDQFNQNHFAPHHTPSAQSWHQTQSPVPHSQPPSQQPQPQQPQQQQSFNPASQPYTNHNSPYQPAPSSYQYGQYHSGHGHGPSSNFVQQQQQRQQQQQQHQQQQQQPQPQPQHHQQQQQQQQPQPQHHQQQQQQQPQPQHHQQPQSQPPQAVVDPSLGLPADPNTIRQQQQSPYQLLRTSTPQGQPSAPPQGLQQNGAPLSVARTVTSTYQTPSEMYTQRPTPTPIPMPVQPVSIPNYEIPKGKLMGGFLHIDQTALAQATNSSPLNKLVNLGTEPMHMPTNRTVLPLYNARQSVKELKKAGTTNKRILENLARRSSSVKSKTKFKASGSSPSNPKRDVSDSDSYTDSSDESDYTDDEDDEPSPLPAARPEEPHAAVRYDVIKATWHPRMSQPDSTKIKTSLHDFWESLNTIQKRWRADSKAVAEAEEQKKTGELPVLKSRVTSQRDLLESALKSALEFAHPDVLYHLGQVKAFLYLCYQFLANRFKAQDYDGGLASVLYQILARSAGTLTNELIEETKVIKALNSMKKNANEANKSMIQQIIDGAAAGSRKQKEQKVNSPPTVETTDPKNVKRPVVPTVSRPLAEGSVVKKPKAPVPATTLVKKGTAAASASKISAAPNVAIPRRPGDKSTPVPVKTKVTQMINKPANVFSSLNAASKKAPVPSAASVAPKSNPQQKPAASAVKKPTPSVARPTTSFAQTMASLMSKEEPAAPTKAEKQLPPETAEQKAKRLRKESRRHLRVTFPPDAKLVEIRIFSHHPEEEQGHDENFVRDAGDIGGEGRMFKQHRDMAEEEDDEEPVLDYRSWNELSSVDFSTVPIDERQRNYAPYGGGEQKPLSPEKEANQRREDSTLLVFYTDPSDIPPSPREPLESSDETVTPAVDFGVPPQFVLDRVPALPMGTDLQKLLSQIQPNLSTQVAPTPPPPTAPTSDIANIGALLQNLTPHSSILAQIPPPPLPSAVPGANLGAVPPPFDPSTFSSILATLVASGAPGGAMPPNLPSLPNLPNFPDISALQQMYSGAMQVDQSSQQTQPQPSQQTNGSKRQRDEASSHNDRSYGSFKKQKGGKYGGERPAYKVIPCKFFKQGNCTKGDDCTYIHDWSAK